MSAVVLVRSSRDRELFWWLAAVLLVVAFTVLAMAPLGGIASTVQHYVAWRLITGQISIDTAVWDIIAVLPWWVPVTGWMLSGLYWWASFVVAFGWEGLSVAIAAISWTGVGALIVAVVGAALIG